MINDGYHNLTMRKVAAGAGISAGNLYYYYRDKNLLLRDLLDAAFAGYAQEFDSIRTNSAADPEAGFCAIITFIIEDLGTLETTNFFPELWAVSNHDGHAAEVMNELYEKERAVLKELIISINPKLSDEVVEHLALFMSASMEGMTPFVGYGKPWNSSRSEMAKIACTNFLQMIKHPPIS